VSLIEARVVEAQSSYEIIGVLDVEKKVDLLARVSGFLVSADFVEGSTVKEGQILFQIEPDQYEAAVLAAEATLLSAQATLAKAQLDFNRTNDLYLKRASPKSDLDTAQSALDVARGNVMAAEAALSQARLNLDYATIRAPFDGYVTETEFYRDSLVGPQSGTLASVITQDPIQVSFGVSDKFMAATRLGNGPLPGQRLDNILVRLKINGESFYPEPGELIYVAPRVDKATDTVKLKAEFKNPEGTLLPNQIVTVHLTAKVPPKVLMIPKPVVMSSLQGNFVFQAVMGPAPGAPVGSPEYLQAKVTLVKIGREYDNGYEILEGLKEGDQVISLGLMSGGAMLRAGSPVRIQDEGQRPEVGTSGVPAKS
jgi:membrane fusion protein (multidrug efflux system)